MNNIAIIPARSGSKGLKDKNIKLLNGKPLIAYTIEAAINSGVFSTVMVSTDSEKYAEISKTYGAEVPFFRSLDNSGDNASSWDVVTEVLQKYNDEGEKFDSVCLLQPTSPLRTADDIRNSYDLLASKACDSITSVCECDHSPLWCMTLNDNLSLNEFRKNLADTPRQKLSKYYRLNGAIYIKRINYIHDNEIELKSNTECAYIMKKENSIDIDYEYDFIIAEAMCNMI